VGGGRGRALGAGYRRMAAAVAGRSATSAMRKFQCCGDAIGYLKTLVAKSAYVLSSLAHLAWRRWRADDGCFFGRAKHFRLAAAPGRRGLPTLMAPFPLKNLLRSPYSELCSVGMAYYTTVVTCVYSDSAAAASTLLLTPCVRKRNSRSYKRLRRCYKIWRARCGALTLALHYGGHLFSSPAPGRGGERKMFNVAHRSDRRAGVDRTVSFGGAWLLRLAAKRRRPLLACA